MTLTCNQSRCRRRTTTSALLALMMLMGAAHDDMGMFGHSRSCSAFVVVPSAARRCRWLTTTKINNVTSKRGGSTAAEEIEMMTTIIPKTTQVPSSSSSSSHHLQIQPRTTEQAVVARRLFLSIGTQSGTLSAVLLAAFPSTACADFAPGGTLLDREVSITFGNLEASPSRSRDNSNVLFPQDNYYKFGAAARWILPPGSTEYPLTVPFVPSQRRYDALKKYGPKVKQSVDAIVRIGSPSSIVANNIPERTDPSYQLRSLGLIADSFLASDNTGTTNELMLARWYINEIYLRIGDYRDALVSEDATEAKACYGCLTKAMNSYLSLLNRSITSKVGEQFSYI